MFPCEVLLLYDILYVNNVCDAICVRYFVCMYNV